MLAAIIPAHNEAAFIAECVRSVRRALAHPLLKQESTTIIVVADDCLDETAAIARLEGATVVTTSVRNVGIARQLGASHAISQGARWLAFTDADSHVSNDWLVQQLKCKADAVCGTIQVANWSIGQDAAQKRFTELYNDADGHAHIHGANFGVSTQAFVRAGGFEPVTAHEDVLLVGALKSMGATICWSAAPRVTTSARLKSKTGEGFGATLSRWNQEATTFQIKNDLPDDTALTA